MTTTALVFSALMVTGSFASAACEINIVREACPGKETEAFKPYGGKKATDEKGKATTADACLAEADKASKIVRKGTLSKKIATAKFDGKEVGKKESTSDCK